MVQKELELLVATKDNAESLFEQSLRFDSPQRLVRLPILARHADGRAILLCRARSVSLLFQQFAQQIVSLEGWSLLDRGSG